ncbi:hypothetical protein [Streptomyces sp. NPDC046685]|uniref:hypothetical protein n=1 Tax=Streptomyces sp. NPDC046685 TaxID=3157202 RepID=UPI0033D13B45
MDSVQEQAVEGSAEPPFGVPPVAFVAPVARDLAYDWQSDVMAMPVDVVYRDGTKVTSFLRVDASRLELLRIQLEQGADRREQILKEQGEYR